MPALAQKHHLTPSKKADDSFLMQFSFLNPVYAFALRNCEGRFD
jgi:hypothetical protein